MNKNLTTTNKNSKLALSKSRYLLDITKELLSKKDIDAKVQVFNYKPIVIVGKEHSIYDMTMTPDGKYIISTEYYNGNIKIWDAESKECINILEGHTDTIKLIAINYESNHLISVSDDKTIKIWDINSTECLYTVKIDDKDVISVMITSDSRYIVFEKKENTVIEAWDIKSEEFINKFVGHTDDVKFITISNDGKYLVSVSDNSIKIWNRINGKCLHTLSEEYLINTVLISPDNSYLISSSYNKTKLWDFNNGEYLETLAGIDTGAHKKILMTPDGKNLIFIEESYSQKFLTIAEIKSNYSQYSYDNKSRNISQFKGGSELEIETFVITPDGKNLLMVSIDEMIEIYDIEATKCIKSNPAFSTILPTSEIFVQSCSNYLKVWNIKKGICTNIYSQYKEIISLTLSTNEKYISIVDKYKNIKILDIQTGNVLYSLSSDYDYVTIDFKGDYALIVHTNDRGDYYQYAQIIYISYDNSYCINTLPEFGSSDGISMNLSKDGNHILKFYSTSIGVYDHMFNELFSIKTWNHEYYVSVELNNNILMMISRDKNKKYAIELYDLKNGFLIESNNIINTSINTYCASNNKQYIAISASHSSEYSSYECNSYLEVFDIYGELIYSDTECGRISEILAVSDDGNLVFYESTNSYGLDGGYTLGILDNRELCNYPEWTNVRNATFLKKSIVIQFETGIVEFHDLYDDQTSSTIHNLTGKNYLSNNAEGHFYANDNTIDKYLRVTEELLIQRKLTKEEIQHFRKEEIQHFSKDNILENEDKDITNYYQNIPLIEIDNDETPF